MLFYQQLYHRIRMDDDNGKEGVLQAAQISRNNASAPDVF